MPVTYTKIQTITVGSGGSNTIVFSDIPSTYSDLLLKASVRKAETGGNSNLQMRFNGSTSGYTQKLMIATAGGTPAVYTDSSEIGFMYLPTGASAASVFTNVEIYLPNYTWGFVKGVSIDGALQNNSSSNSGMYITNAEWSGTAAINQVYLYCANGSGNFAQYSEVSLYGILRA